MAKGPNTKTLEELLTEMFNGKTGPKFNLPSNVQYSRKPFVDAAGDIFDLEDYYSNLASGKGSVSNIRDLREILRNNAPQEMLSQDNLEKLETNQAFALDWAESFLSDGYISLARYVSHNRDKLLEKLSDEDLVGLVSRVPLYKTGNAKYDRIRELRAKVFAIRQAQDQGKDPTEVVAKDVDKLIESYTPNLRAFIDRNKTAMLPAIIDSQIKKVLKDYSNAFKNAEGKIDRKMMLECLKTNYKVAEDFIKDLPDKEKVGYWDKNLKNHYVEIARALFPSEKAKYKVDKDKDKEERKAKAKGLGLTNP